MDTSSGNTNHRQGIFFQTQQQRSWKRNREPSRQKLVLDDNKVEHLPFTTTIEASIRTTTDDSIWTKQYPCNINDM